jgi:streptogramin lyase
MQLKDPVEAVMTPRLPTVPINGVSTISWPTPHMGAVGGLVAKASWLKRAARTVLFIGYAALATFGWLASAAAQTITTYTPPTGVGCNGSTLLLSIPGGIIAGPDGNIWWSGLGSPNGRMSTAGTNATTYIDALYPDGENDNCDHNQGIVVGSDSAIYYSIFTPNGAYPNIPGRIGRIVPGGSAGAFDIPEALGENPGAIAAGPDGALWFTERAGSGPAGAYPASIIRMTTGGQFTAYNLPSSGFWSGAFPMGITTGPDGALWFAANGGSDNSGPL